MVVRNIIQGSIICIWSLLMCVVYEKYFEDSVILNLFPLVALIIGIHSAWLCIEVDEVFKAPS